MTTPRSTAAINATADQKAHRNIERIKTLRAWMQQASERAGTDRAPTPEKVASMQDELTRREADAAALKAQLDAL